MKNIKIYELFDEIDDEVDPVEIFFKDKINWKDYNYLLDQLTKYEDEGYEVILFVICGDMGVYFYRTNLETCYVGQKHISYLKRQYKKTGLYYQVHIFKDGYVHHDYSLLKLDRFYVDLREDIHCLNIYPEKNIIK